MAVTYEVTTRVAYYADKVSVALERFYAYLESRGWKRLARTEAGIPPSRVTIPCTAGGDVCYREIFRLQHADNSKTAADAKRVVTEAIFATGGLGRLVEVGVQTWTAGVEKTEDFIKQVGDDVGKVAGATWCASIKASTGISCTWFAVIAGGLAGLYVLNSLTAAKKTFLGGTSNRGFRSLRGPSWDEAKAELARREADERQNGRLLETYKGVRLYYNRGSYSAPALKEYGYGSERQLKNAVSRKLKKTLGGLRGTTGRMLGSMDDVLLKQIDAKIEAGGGWASVNDLPGGEEFVSGLVERGVLEEDGGYVRRAKPGTRQKVFCAQCDERHYPGEHR